MDMGKGLQRVCFLTDSFYPIVGGGETHGRLLCNALLQAGAKVFVLTQRKLPGLPSKETLEGLPVYRVGPAGFQRFGKYLMLLPVLLALFWLHDEYDIIYVAGMRTLGMVGVLAAMIMGKVSVLRSETPTEFSGDFMLQHTPGKSGGWLRHLLQPGIAARKWILRKADGFVSIAGLIRAEYETNGVRPDKICDIPNGIDPRCFYPVVPEQKMAQRAALSLPADQSIFVYTGKLNRGKGLEMLLRTWQRVALANPQAHLVLVGGGANQFLSCETELRAMVEQNGLQERVTFTGYVTNVADYLQAADFFVFPSEFEAQPMAVLEALACGLPAIVTNAGGITEVVEHGVNGRIISVGDEEALYQEMIVFLNNPELAAALGASGRLVIESRFSIGAVAGAHLQYFAELQRRKTHKHPVLMGGGQGSGA